MDKIELLKQYKELLDSDIITKEEFEAKKKEILEAPETNTNSNKSLDSIIKGVKEKTNQAKALASEKLEDVKKAQEQEEEKRKLAEEERKAREAELEKEKEEKARLEEEKKLKEAEEKRIKQEEKKAQKEALKKERKEKRKAFFSKKSVKITIGVICALIVAFLAFCVYAYMSRDTIKNDFADTATYKVHDLSFEVPSNWSEDTDGYVTPAGDAADSKQFVRFDKDNGNLIAGAVYMYFGEDLNIHEVASSQTDDGTWSEYSISEDTDSFIAFKKDGAEEVQEYLSVAEADYSTFVTYISVTNSALDEATVDAMLLSPKYGEYKNKLEADSLSVKYKGSNEDGYNVTLDDYEVTVNYKDGTNSKAQNFTVTPEKATIHSGKTVPVSVKCHGIKEDIKLKGKQVDKIKVSYSGDTQEGVTIEKGNADLTVKVIWDDGSEETITDYTMDKAITLKAGETGKATITAFGKTATLEVECSTMTEAQFKDKCKTRNYKDLLRKASYDKYTKIYGKVVQDCGSGYYRITSGGSQWDDVYMVTVLSGDTLVEDDWVTCYGFTSGIYSYETVMGATQKVPWLTAKYVDFD